MTSLYIRNMPAFIDVLPHIPLLLFFFLIILSLDNSGFTCYFRTSNFRELKSYSLWWLHSYGKTCV